MDDQLHRVIIERRRDVTIAVGHRAVQQLAARWQLGLLSQVQVLFVSPDPKDGLPRSQHHVVLAAQAHISGGACPLRFIDAPVNGGRGGHEREGHGGEEGIGEQGQAQQRQHDCGCSDSPPSGAEGSVLAL